MKQREEDQHGNDKDVNDRFNELLAIAMMILENLRGTESWGYLCPMTLAASWIVSIVWLWSTDELLVAWKGYIVIGLLFSAFASSTLAKRVRDEQYVELVYKYGRNTPLYHETSMNQLRGSESFRLLTCFDAVLSVAFLFGGIWVMPFNFSSKWMLTAMCWQNIVANITYAYYQRNLSNAGDFESACRKLAPNFRQVF